MDNNFTVLEELIFKYFLEKLECYASNKINSDNFSDVCNRWANEKLDSPVYFNMYINDFFEPELGISAKELLLTLKLNKLSFKDYIVGIMNKFDVKSQLEADKILKESAAYEASDDEVEAAKQLAIQQMLGTEDIDLSNLSDEELDNVMAKTAINQSEEENTESEEDKKQLVAQKLGSENINVDGLTDEQLDAILSGESLHEKIHNIVVRFNEKTAIYCIHKYLGMNLEESKAVYNDAVKEKF